jgi:hypothetical protein
VLSPARERDRGQRLACPVETVLLALQADEDLPFPAFLDPLDPDRGEVDRHAILEARAEESVHVRVGGAIPAAVLVDREHPLGAPGGSTEGLLDGVTKNALAEEAVEPLEALRRGLSTVRMKRK